MIKIAIPSYRRVDTLMNKTLAYLKRTDFDINNVFLFVADKDEKKAYQSTGVKNIVVGVPTIKAQRNFIRGYFKEGEKVFSMDDDLAGLFRAVSVKKVEEVQDLTTLLREGFSIAERFKVKLWGVSAVLNPFFMYNKQVSFDLKYIVGAAFGQIIKHGKHLDQTIDDKGDYERSIKYYIEDGAVMRYNNIAVKTNYYKEKGGMQETRTKERVEWSGKYLLQKYPDHCRVNTAKKNKEFFEIKLHHSR